MSKSMRELDLKNFLFYSNDYSLSIKWLKQSLEKRDYGISPNLINTAVEIAPDDIEKLVWFSIKKIQVGTIGCYISTEQGVRKLYALTGAKQLLMWFLYFNNLCFRNPKDGKIFDITRPIDELVSEYDLVPMDLGTASIRAIETTERSKPFLSNRQILFTCFQFEQGNSELIPDILDEIMNLKL